MIPSIWSTLDDAQEREFRASKQTEETRRLTVLVVVVVAVNFVYVPFDLGFDLPGRTVAVILALRGLVVSCGVAVLVLARSGAGHVTRDRLVVAWGLVFVVLDLFTSATRPPEYIGYVALTPLIVLVLYMVVPAPPAARVGLAAIETVGQVVVVLGSELAGAAVFTFILALLVAHAVGLTALWDLHRLARDEFMALRAEQEARAELETALEEIRTLRGIIPICSACKKVRNDEGAWEQMEAYVTERAHIRFSHGICPSCSEELYGSV